MAQVTSMNTRISQIGSAMVVVSYFLVWGKSWLKTETGIQILGDAFKGMKDMKGDQALLGIFMLVALTSPLLCNAINLWTTLFNEDVSPTFRTSRTRYQVGAVKVSAGSFMS